ncbi:hypothetical protein [Alkalihalobacillus sp. TS-13]|uniref:DUF7010 family protein n=1 Tax=Alkalihalobacillus sp. TS-13 TaxID=2842455 RepID=UPI001C8747E9|nr:hypothetical protein [Alkalihalobacillus sp. TS-13]
MRNSKELPAITSKEGYERGKRINFWFNMIFLGEGIAIGITIAVCNFINQTDLIPGIIALIVGIHFFPLAHLFQVKLYHVTGALLCLLALISFTFLSTAIEFGNRTVLISFALLGFGSALILWATGLIIWITTKRYRF